MKVASVDTNANSKIHSLNGKCMNKQEHAGSKRGSAQFRAWLRLTDMTACHGDWPAGASKMARHGEYPAPICSQ